ncbi:arylsulfatase [Aliifodinibius sp. S!AR15-10]|nr:arylsulfatase [Aliifodinibius sp. S!AR15-10]
MGYGDLGSYNPNSKIPTPNIDHLADEGMRFTDAHSAGALCHPARYGLLTGRYPFRTDVNSWPHQSVIEEERMTIASLLKQQGYHTAMVGKWHLGFDEDTSATNRYDQLLPGGPLDRGFDQFFGIRASTDIPPYFYIQGNKAIESPTSHIQANNTPGWSPIQGKFWREGDIAPGLKLKDVLPRFTDEAIKVINTHLEDTQNPPLMLYLALPAPHTPWLPTEKYEDQSGAGLYGDFTVMVDAMVGKVLEALDENHMRDNTLVMLTSDNGPVWYEENVEKFGHDSAGGLRGMKGDAWEAGHRMPFIVRWPGKVKAGAVSDELINFTDVMSTLADIVNVKLPENAGEDSYSFLPVLEGDQHERPPMVIPSLAARDSDLKTIRSGKWKLITGRGSGGFSDPRSLPPETGPAGQLYNLNQDPGETVNRYGNHPDVVDSLTRKLQQIQAE